MSRQNYFVARDGRVVAINFGSAGAEIIVALKWLARVKAKLGLR
jgi:hypothetical protein